MQRRLPDRAAGRWDEAPLVAAAAVLEAVAGSEGGTSHFELMSQYTHRFCLNGVQSSAYSLCLGPFGGNTDHDLMLVQSLDCRITIYENDVGTAYHYPSLARIPHDA